MQVRLRLALWVVLWVVSLLSVPALLPPAREPTYVDPAPSVGESWSFGPTEGYLGTPSPGADRVTMNVTEVDAGRSTLNFSTHVTGAPSASPRWPFLSWTLGPTDGAWVAFAWSCADGSSWANLSQPLPVGITFPLEAGSSENSSAPALVSGACGSGDATVLVNGSYTRTYPPGSAISCVLYVCNALRQYAMAATVVVVSSTTGALWAAWHLRGLYDPLVSGFRSIAVSPGRGPQDENGSTNLSLATTNANGDPPTPNAFVEFGESALLLVAVPLLAIVLEGLLLRRRSRREEEEDERAVLAAVAGAAERQAASDPVSAIRLEEETAPTGPLSPPP